MRLVKDRSSSCWSNSSKVRVKNDKKNEWINDGDADDNVIVDDNCKWKMMREMIIWIMQPSDASSGQSFFFFNQTVFLCAFRFIWFITVSVINTCKQALGLALLFLEPFLAFSSVFVWIGQIFISGRPCWQANSFFFYYYSIFLLTSINHNLLMFTMVSIVCGRPWTKPKQQQQKNEWKKRKKIIDRWT